MKIRSVSTATTNINCAILSGMNNIMVEPKVFKGILDSRKLSESLTDDSELPYLFTGCINDAAIEGLMNTMESLYPFNNDDSSKAVIDKARLLQLISTSSALCVSDECIEELYRNSDAEFDYDELLLRNIAL